MKVRFQLAKFGQLWREGRKSCQKKPDVWTALTGREEKLSKEDRSLDSFGGKGG
ncbi:hypothetical protein [Mesobacillus jeotgali]|uniref:hypothetical protein n=1 Tax=Mesobacillus jeotgali TaxID=129985 RepID=UPI001590B949|nr:hypothetical protein [Mesobacillus jeotgali]